MLFAVLYIQLFSIIFHFLISFPAVLQLVLVVLLLILLKTEVVYLHCLYYLLEVLVVLRDFIEKVVDFSPPFIREDFTGNLCI